MKEKALASYAKKGDDVVQMNYQAIERGANEVVEVPVPAEWKDCKDEVLGEQAVSGKPEVLDFVNNIQKPINACQGDKLHDLLQLSRIHHTELGQRPRAAPHSPEASKPDVQRNQRRKVYRSHPTPHATLKHDVLRVVEGLRADQHALQQRTVYPSHRLATHTLQEELRAVEEGEGGDELVDAVVGVADDQRLQTRHALH